MDYTINAHHLTVTLTDEEYELLRAFADERGIIDLEVVLPAVLHDRLWDK